MRVDAKLIFFADVENIQIVRKDPSTTIITHVYLFESYRY